MHELLAAHMAGNAGQIVILHTDSLLLRGQRGGVHSFPAASAVPAPLQHTAVVDGAPSTIRLSRRVVAGVAGVAERLV